MMSQSSGRRGLVWAIIGGLVLIAGIVAIVVASSLAQRAPGPTRDFRWRLDIADADRELRSRPASSSIRRRLTMGWVPEPITTDADTYIRAALEAASTFDTTKSTREEWLDYLDTWFTPDTRYTSEADQRSAMEASQVELRQGVVLPQEEWDSLASEDGRVVATATGDIGLRART